jgi:hypothetical protein
MLLKSASVNIQRHANEIGKSVNAFCVRGRRALNLPAEAGWKPDARPLEPVESCNQAIDYYDGF